MEADNPNPSVETLWRAVKALEAMSATSPSALFQEEAERLLGLMARKCAEVQRGANDYPVNPIRANVWMDGAALGQVAESLAFLLKKCRLTVLEEEAHALRCTAILAVQSHYHHIVGPAMLDRADCVERLADAPQAVSLYDAVIADFRWLVEEWESETTSPSAEDRFSLECLAQALRRRLALEPRGAEELHSLLERCSGVLERAALRRWRKTLRRRPPP